jgi:hypothetical protein
MSGLIDQAPNVLVGGLLIGATRLLFDEKKQRKKSKKRKSKEEKARSRKKLKKVL